MESTQRLLCEITIDASPDVVWTALRDPAQIQEWFGWQYDGLSDEIQGIFFSDVAADGEHALRWPHGDVIALQRNGNRTVVQTFRPTADSDSMREQAADIDEGWLAFVEQLRFWLNRHRDEQRATVFLSGAAREPNASVAEALGLAVASATNSRYEAVLNSGEVLSGEVWARHGNVTCLTVDSYGDGLIVLVNHDSQRHPPHGGGMVTLTTFGLSPERFEEIRASWASTWASKYEPSPDFGAEVPA
ncbi:MAG: hypothetical protein ACKVVP_13320 [Chloroflexota bacterium]